MKAKDFDRHCSTLPAPIALSLQHAVQCIDAIGQMKKYCSTLEIFTRYLAAIAYAEYCSYPKEDSIETIVTEAQRSISNGEAIKRVQAILRALRSKEDPFLLDLIDWFFDEKGKASPYVEQLLSLIQRRNRFIHKELSLEEMKDFPIELCALFDSATWLQDYQFFVLLQQDPIAPVGFDGVLRWLVGLGLPSDTTQATWQNIRLYTKQIYLLDCEKNRFLCLSPFLLWHHDPLCNEEKLHCRAFDLG